MTIFEDFIENVENGELKSHTVSTRETHTATAHVGRDLIEAEYFIFDHSPLWEPKKMKWFEKLLDVVTTPYYKVKWKIRDAYWEIHYGFQRMFKGYDNVDIFETFAKFIEHYSKILKDLRNCHYGYPGTITAEEWNNVLDEMIYHLHYMDEEPLLKSLKKTCRTTGMQAQRQFMKLWISIRMNFLSYFRNISLISGTNEQKID